MSAVKARASRRDIRRALGSEAETMLQNVAEGMQQFGLQLNTHKTQLAALREDFGALLDRQDVIQDHWAERFYALRNRGFLGRFRWLLTGK